MYHLKPINDLSKPISIPDVMYRLKPINDAGEIRKQESFSKQDIVISAHPSHPPYGILLAYHQLKARGLKIYTSCHTHSSITGSLPENVQDFLPMHQDDLTRSEADVIITIIWKKLADRDPTIVVSPIMKHSSLKGEINILRYLTRLYPSIWNYGSNEDPKVEYYLDVIHSDLVWCEGSGRHQKEEIIFKGLEATFLSSSGSSPFLGGGSEPGILDLIAWSIATRDHGKLAVPSTALKKWLTSCNKVCAFYGSRQHRLSSHRYRRSSHGAGNGSHPKKNHSSSKAPHKNNKKRNKNNHSLDVDTDFAPGSIVSRQWPSIPDIVNGDPSELFVSDFEAVVTEKLDGSNLALSSNGVVASRRVVLLKKPDRHQLSKFVFAGVSLESLSPHLDIISDSLTRYFSEHLHCSSLLVTVYGELIQNGTATSKEDKFRYKERGYLPGQWHAFGISIATEDNKTIDKGIEKLKELGFIAKSHPSVGPTGEQRSDHHIILSMNSHLESLFHSFQLPTIETKTLPFKKIFETYEGKLLQSDSCEGLVITVLSNGAIYKWKQRSGGFLIKNGTFFKEKSSDSRYSNILRIMKKVAGVSEGGEKVEDLLKNAYESACTKYPDAKDNEKFSSLITEEILKDLKLQEINENQVRQFILKQR